MSGDWIKFEHSTLEKPEVALFSEMLGVKVDEGVGILVRFWVWLDRNSRNGLVTLASRSSIDTIMHCPGFSGALEAVGWVVFDDKARSMALQNFDRHNGNPAKTRALGALRASRYRNGESVTNALPEKRREEVKSKALRPYGFETPTVEVSIAQTANRLTKRKHQNHTMSRDEQLAYVERQTRPKR